MLPQVAVALKRFKIQQQETVIAENQEKLYLLEAMVEDKVILHDYRIQSVSGGRDALAQVHVKVTFKGVESTGRASAQDVLEASAKAYVNALNRVLLQVERQKEQV